MNFPRLARCERVDRQNELTIHHGQHSFISHVLIGLGVVLEYNYERCGRLWASILIHMLFNGVIISLHLLE